MKSRIFIATLSFISIALSSCNKQKAARPADPDLSGKWKMHLYIDSAAGVTETKEDSYLHFNPYMGSTPYPPPGDVVMNIAFEDAAQSTGEITGSTIFNAFSLKFLRPGNYQFTTSDGMWTLAGDVPWSGYFMDCIKTTSAYSFNTEAKLLLHSPGKTLFFIRE